MATLLLLLLFYARRRANVGADARNRAAHPHPASCTRLHACAWGRWERPAQRVRQLWRRRAYVPQV